jgi:hypothetical protein
VHQAVPVADAALVALSEKHWDPGESADSAAAVDVAGHCHVRFRDVRIEAAWVGVGLAAS